MKEQLSSNDGVLSGDMDHSIENGIALRARVTELLNLVHEAMPYMLNASQGQDDPRAEWVRRAHKAGGSLLAGYHTMNQQPFETKGG